MRALVFAHVMVAVFTRGVHGAVFAGGPFLAAGHFCLLAAATDIYVAKEKSQGECKHRNACCAEFVSVHGVTPLLNS